MVDNIYDTTEDVDEDESDNIKDLFEGIDELSWVDKDQFEYYCDSCGWEGDLVDYGTIQRDSDDEGYLLGENQYVERCPRCGFIFKI